MLTRNTHCKRYNDTDHTKVHYVMIKTSENAIHIIIIEKEGQVIDIIIIVNGIIFIVSQVYVCKLARPNANDNYIYCLSLLKYIIIL